MRHHASTIDRVDDARRRDGELAVAVGHEGRVLEDGLLAAAARALEEDLRVRVVGHDGPAAGLDRGRAEGELVGDRHDLVRDDDGDAEGLGDLLELGQVAIQRLLALVVASTDASSPLTTNGINFIDKN